MARVQIVGGVLEVEGFGGDRPDNSLPGGGHIDNSLPPHFPPIGSTLPEPPPGVWPPISGWNPIVPAPPGTPPGVIWPPVGHPPSWGGGHPARPTDPGFGQPARPARPDAGLPGAPARPDTGLPGRPARPDAGLPSAPVRPDAGLPSAPVRPDAGLPVPPASTKPPETPTVYYVIAGIPGVGWRYVTVDPSLIAGMPLPTPPSGIDNTLPPTAEVKPIEPPPAPPSAPKG
jgi:hypothetical protein